MSKMLKPAGMLNFRASLDTAQMDTRDLSELAKRVEEHESDALVATVLSPKGQVREQKQTEDGEALVKKKAPEKSPAKGGQQDHLRPCSIKLSDDELKIIEAAAEKNNTTRSRFMRAIVQEWINNQNRS